MRRLVVTTSVALAAAGFASAALGTPQVARSKAVVRLKSCSLADHSAVFYARMRRVSGTKQMRMRFTLLERPAGATRYKRVRAPGLGRWRKSAAGVQAFGYRQEVRGLHDGSAYRMRVRYRWFGENHRLLRSARRTSSACRMYVTLPNLRVRIVDARPYSDGVWRYRVRVTNVGQAAADDVGVELIVDGSAVDTEPIARLDPGDSQPKALYGPACLHKWAALVDPTDAIPETNEGDNQATSYCVTLG